MNNILRDITDDGCAVGDMRTFFHLYETFYDPIYYVNRRYRVTDQVARVFLINGLLELYALYVPPAGKVNVKHFLYHNCRERIIQHRMREHRMERGNIVHCDWEVHLPDNPVALRNAPADIRRDLVYALADELGPDKHLLHHTIRQIVTENVKKRVNINPPGQTEEVERFKWVLWEILALLRDYQVAEIG